MRMMNPEVHDTVDLDLSKFHKSPLPTKKAMPLSEYNFGENTINVRRSSEMPISNPANDDINSKVIRNNSSNIY